MQSYLQEHKRIAEDHISDVKQQYHDQEQKVNSEVREVSEIPLTIFKLIIFGSYNFQWKINALLYGEMKRSHVTLSRNLTAQKSHLTTLYADKFM